MVLIAAEDYPKYAHCRDICEMIACLLAEERDSKEIERNDTARAVTLGQEYLSLRGGQKKGVCKNGIISNPLELEKRLRKGIAGRQADENDGKALGNGNGKRYTLGEIKKTMGHPALKGGVCKAPCFLDAQKLNQ